jgi:hypothetical protein
LPRVLANPDLARRVAPIIDETLKSTAGLSEKYSCAAELARQAILKLTGPASSHKGPSDIGGKLHSKDLQITSSAPPLIKYYHLFELADIDYGDSSKVVEQLYYTYSKLGTMANLITSNLEALRLAIF